ncbi:MAG: hypothetical protein ACT6WE_15545, partial [Shinella sp.]
MKIKTSILAGACLSCMVLGGTAAQAAECGTTDPITVAEMTWLSAGTLAYVTKAILAEGYGCT